MNVLHRQGFTFSSGFDCTVRSEIPINAGTSSSSALVVAWTHFLLKMSLQLPLFKPEEIAELAYQAEVLEFAAPGGMMDQYSTALGGIVFLNFLPQVRVERIDAALGSFVLGDSGEPKDTKAILARVRGEVTAICKQLTKLDSAFSLAMSTTRISKIWVLS